MQGANEPIPSTDGVSTRQILLRSIDHVHASTISLDERCRLGTEAS